MASTLSSASCVSTDRTTTATTSRRSSRSTTASGWSCGPENSRHREQPRARCREFSGPHDHPLAVVDLLDLREVVAVVVRSVETQLAEDSVDAILLQPLRERLVVQALG